MNTEQILAIPTENVWNILNYQDKGVIKALDVDIMDKLLHDGVFVHAIFWKRIHLINKLFHML